MKGAGYVVAPPSTHASGRRYLGEIGFEPEHVPLAPVPGWLMGLLAERPGRLGFDGTPLEIVEGERNRRFDERRSGRKEMAVGGFCCPAPPKPLESPSVARWGPTALLLRNVSPLGRQLRGNRERLVIVGTCVNGPSRWTNPIGNPAFIALVDPVSPPSATLAQGGG